VLPVNWAVYGALIAAALAVAGATAFVVVRALHAWRDVKRARRQLTRELDRIAEAGERAAAAAERAGDTTELAAALRRLRVTLGRFAVLRSAVDEATGAAGGLTALYPRK
jgi:Flp pilus assembly protein TadB